MRHLIHLTMFALALSFIGCKDEVCDEGYEGDDCDTEVRAKYLGTWTGPNMCDESILPIDINTITVIISESETDILDITLELVLNSETIDVDIPSETTMLIGNAFETGPTETVLFTFPTTVSSDGIFRSETELSMDFTVNIQDIPYIGSETLSCSADLVKQ